MTPPITITEPRITGYNKIRYHCPACNFHFDIGDFIPPDDLPQEPILLCPKCGGTALRVTPEESRTLQEFSQAEKQVRKLITNRRKEAEIYKTRLDTPESEQ